MGLIKRNLSYLYQWLFWIQNQHKIQGFCFENALIISNQRKNIRQFDLKIVQKIEENKQNSQISQKIQLYIILNNLSHSEFKINGSLIIRSIHQQYQRLDITFKQNGIQMLRIQFLRRIRFNNNQLIKYKDDQINCQNQIKLLNQSQIRKINSKQEKFKLFQEYQQLKDILNKLNEQTSKMWIIQQQQQINPNQLLLINDTIEQQEDCLVIVFDSTGKIMVSSCGNKIII
ncbi:unnamed protein product [Paramecium primaurelia]|uniref:Uncharacterized protein n=1 Tax=Paramecium primaurelia TaxID=5886 RepID=A0A8S1MKZ7_PARPR|nr:unnamed protein product [Paramecium primaurelia]